MRIPFGKCATAGLNKNSIPGLKRKLIVFFLPMSFWNHRQNLPVCSIEAYLLQTQIYPYLVTAYLSSM
jgi:hypothetical protein